MSSPDEPKIRNHLIGGVFPLEKPRNSPCGKTLLQHVCAASEKTHFFKNCRSALHYTFKYLSPTRIWLPAYLCPEILQAIAGLEDKCKYFPLSTDLQPDAEFLENKIEPNDVILTINYFGRGPSQSWMQFIDQHASVVWIEDCAQALDSGLNFISDFRVYSPRKILGIPDGGVLADRLGRLPAPELADVTDYEFMIPYQLRAEDILEKNNAIWYDAYLNAELNQRVGSLAISHFSHDLLRVIPLDPIVRARQENYKYLSMHLKDLAVFPDYCDQWTPLCFPILSTEANVLASYLAMNGVFPPRYWQNLPSDPHEFSFEHSLSEKLLGLPCDQRYSKQEMMKIVQLIRNFQA